MTSPPRAGRQEQRIWLTLLTLFIVAFSFRLANINWQLPHHLHPDEAPQVEGALAQAYQGNFATGYRNQPPGLRNLFTIELLVMDRLGLLGGPLDEIDNLATAELESGSPVLQRAYVVARTTSALFGGATAVVLFLAARPLLGTVPALLSAFTLALSLTHIRESHFGTTTVPALFFSALALYFASLYVARGAWKFLAGSVFAAGLAFTIRDLMVVTVLFPAMAFLLRAPRPDDPRWWLRRLAVVLVLVLSAAAAFVVVTPYERSAALQNGLLSLPKLKREVPTLDHVGEVATFYGSALAQSLGAPTLVIAAFGLVRMAVRQPRALLLHGLFAAVIIGVLLLNLTEAVRFGIPLELFVAVCAGYGLGGVLVILRRANVARWVQAAAMLLPFATLLTNALILTWLMAQKDTRVLAFDWIQSSLSPSSTVYAPRFSIPGARAEHASNTRVPLASIRPEQIATAFTGDGCGEYVAVSSVESDLAGTAPVGSDTSVRDAVLGQGDLVARFSPSRGPDVRMGPDDGFSPFWNLYGLERPGPIVEIYAMSPPCSERMPTYPLADLVTLTETSKSTGLSALPDPRFDGQGSWDKSIRADGLPRDTRAAALGRFIPGESGLALAIVFRDRNTDYLGLYRVAPGYPPQLVLIERQLVACDCVTARGLATMPAEDGGPDRLAILSLEAGVERIELAEWDGSLPRLVHRWWVASPSGIPASGLASVPPDASGPGRLALLYIVGSQFRFNLLQPDPVVSELDPLDQSPTSSEYRLPSDSGDYLPAFAIGDFDGNGRNDLALADASHQSVHIFRMPPVGPGLTGTLAHVQERRAPEGAKFLQSLRPESWNARPSTPPELVALDWVGNDLQLLELSLDASSPYPLRLQAAPGVVIPDRSSVIGLAEGRFLKQDPLPSVAMMTQDGRLVTLELYRRDASGALQDKPAVLDRWRTEEDDRPLRNSLAAVDLDEDGIDELASGRIGSTGQFKEFHFHSLTMTPNPGATLVRIDREMVPRGAEFTAVSRLASAQGNLAVAYRQSEQDMVAFLEIPREGPARVIRTCNWVSDSGRLSGLAALPSKADFPTFAVVERDLEGQNLVRSVTLSGGQLQPTRAFSWPNVRARDIWVAAAR